MGGLAVLLWPRRLHLLLVSPRSCLPTLPPTLASCPSTSPPFSSPPRTSSNTHTSLLAPPPSPGQCCPAWPPSSTSLPSLTSSALRTVRHSSGLCTLAMLL